ncbi:hypothetical protein P9112_003029 [Eukaryota sp. TZLM1-RC]
MPPGNLPPLIAKEVDIKHERIYNASGILIVDPDYIRGVPHVLVGFQHRPRSRQRLVIHILGGKRRSSDRDMRETAFRELYEETGELIEGSVFQSFDDAYESKKTSILWHPPGKFGLFVVSLWSFDPEDQEMLRNLPQDFERKYGSGGSRAIAGLVWVPLIDLLRTCKSSYILFKKQHVDTVDFGFDSLREPFGLGRMAVEILGRHPVSEYLKEWFVRS